MDKVKHLKEKGPLPQHGGVKVLKDGSILISEKIKIKASGKPQAPKRYYNGKKKNI